MRVHGRAARALANQSLPYSVCTILKDEELYNPIVEATEDKTRDARSRFNGRIFLSWLQDVDDKWEKIKVSKKIMVIVVIGANKSRSYCIPPRFIGIWIFNLQQIFKAHRKLSNLLVSMSYR